MSTHCDHNLRSNVPSALLGLLREVSELSQSFLVGGFVRDGVLGIPAKDIDVEVFGVSYSQLADTLQRFGRIDLVGKSFGVIKFTHPECGMVDFAIPRRDSKIAPGHRGFEMAFDATLPPNEAARRRDFTMNALMYDPREGAIHDYYDGLSDLEHGLLREVDPLTFPDDPLRVLRAMQFVARFDLKPTAGLTQIAREMKATYGELANERVSEEWLKWAAKSRRPSAGLQFLLDSGWIEHFPELAQMVGVEQDPEWHPEGDVFTHTQHCCDALAGLEPYQTLESKDRAVYMLAVLLHDIGKASTTSAVMRDGKRRITSPGHERVSAREAENFLQRLGFAETFSKRVVPLVANHMVQFEKPTDRAIRRLANRLQPETIERLGLVMTADSLGRPPKSKGVPKMLTAILEHAAKLDFSGAAPQPILLGRDLIDLGMSPGIAMGKLLKRAFEAQLDGEFSDHEGALGWARRHLE